MYGNVIRGIESQVISIEGFTHEHSASADNWSDHFYGQGYSYPGIQNMMNRLSPGQKDTESDTYNKNQEDKREELNRFEKKKVSRSNFELRDT